MTLSTLINQHVQIYMTKPNLVFPRLSLSICHPHVPLRSHPTAPVSLSRSFLPPRSQREKHWGFDTDRVMRLSNHGWVTQNPSPPLFPVWRPPVLSFKQPPFPFLSSSYTEQPTPSPEKGAYPFSSNPRQLFFFPSFTVIQFSILI